MRTAGNITAATGLTVFILAGCSLDSLEPYGTVALIVALAGLVIAYLGYRLEEIAERVCKRMRSWKRQRRKHRKVKVWLGRAQRNF